MIPNNPFAFTHGNDYKDGEPVILVITGSDVWGEHYSLDGWFQSVHEEFSSGGFNVIYCGSKQSQGKSYIRLPANGIRECMKRKESNDNSHHKANKQLMDRWVLDCFGKFDVKRIFVLGAKGNTGILPLQSFIPKDISEEAYKRQNEFHDWVEPISPELEDAIECIIPQITESKVSATGYTTVHLRTYLSIVENIMNTQDRCELDVCMIDPSVFYQWFMQWGKSRCRVLYFADDKRGTRNFTKFPLDYFQHMVYDKTRDEENAGLDVFLGGQDYHEKDKNLIFAGSIIYDKGTRPEKWDQYFDEFRDERSDLFIPLRKNGVNQKFHENDSQKKLAQIKHGKLYTKITEHQCFRNSLLQDELRKAMSRYKYGLILKCVSHYDSLNFRPLFYVQHGVLPFFDPEYDPHFLQIPKHLQEQLVVKDHKDLHNLITWYNGHIDIREKLLDELHDLLIGSWENVMLQYYFEILFPELKYE